MDDKVMEYVERKRRERRECLAKPDRYREKGELERIEAALLTLECLAMELGLIDSCTI